jgi:hypothetical protein
MSPNCDYATSGSYIEPSEFATQTFYFVRFVAAVTFPSTPKKPTPAGSGATASFSRLVGSPSAFPAIDFEKGVVWC